MYRNEGNIGVAYQRRELHSTADARQMKKIAHLIKKVFKLKYFNLKQFQELAGKLQHASFGIPGGKGLFLPIYQAIKTA